MSDLYPLPGLVLGALLSPEGIHSNHPGGRRDSALAELSRFFRWVFLHRGLRLAVSNAIGLK